MIGGRKEKSPLKGWLDWMLMISPLLISSQGERLLVGGHNIGKNYFKDRLKLAKISFWSDKRGC